MASKGTALLGILAAIGLVGCPKQETENPHAAPSAAPGIAVKSGSTCQSAAESMKNAKPHRSADPPYADCAYGVFAHCGGGKGERGGLCSRSLDQAATAAARKQTPDACCYVPAD